jgi:pyruvate dehydrogenase E2 component (dihydrolipoamide acetyltransferase)
MSDIKPIVMPKWGLAMQEGTLAKWSVQEGETIAPGQEIMDIETSKIANVFESPVGGVLRKRVANDGEVLPVGALLGVVAEPGTPEAAIESFVAEFLARFETAAKEDVAPPEPTMVDVGGKRTRYLKLGPDTGTPVVFIHGFGSDHAAWLFNHTAAAETHPAYALDLLGHGSSSAAIATLVAAAKPSRAASLALIAPAGVGSAINGAFLDGFLQEVRGKKLRPVLESLVANPDLITGDMVEDVLKSKRLDGAEAALTTIRNANLPGSTQAISVTAQIAALTCPVMAIAGAQDAIIPPDQIQSLPASVSKHVIAGAGHIPHMEKANEVNALLARLR